MKPIKKLSGLIDLIRSKPTWKMAVAYPHDEDTLMALDRAESEKIVDAILVGDEKVIKDVCKKLGIDSGRFEIVHEPDEKKSGDRAVRLVAENKAHILMKGLISTPYYLRALLNKEYNLVPKDGVLSHAALIEFPTYDKLLIVSDVAMIPYPDLCQKVQMLQYDITIAMRLGIENPKVAIITANEKVSDKMPPTIDAAIIAKMADRKQIKGAIVDGPLALDLALSKHSCEVKGVKTPIDGDADILIMPNIDAGNIFFKTASILAKGTVSGIVTGARCPAVLVSRADDDDSKFYSIALAAVMV